MRINHSPPDGYSERTGFAHGRISRRTAIQAGGIGLLGLGVNHVAGLRALALWQTASSKLRTHEAGMATETMIRAPVTRALRSGGCSAMLAVAARLLLVAWLLVGARRGVLAADEPPARVGFNRDVRPILSNHCFRCHGPDSAARQAELRLDRRDEALARRAITPGKPLASELVRRTTATDDDVMPPRDSGLALNPAAREVLRRWIEQGAEYEPHWSLVAPRAAPLPPVRELKRVRNAIDHFVIADLERRGMTPAPECDAATLWRRVSLALTALPPTTEELEALLSDRAPDASERAVDRLLGSPRFGERMAAVWLDAARYADTNGYFGDNPRQIWPWRDWVIDAFNRNMPFDQFTVEQLAGDLLPDATLEQKIGTGFNRNHMVTDETGVIDEEYRVEYVADRLETTGTVWLGLTVGCARCHDHKYDPLTQREYYQLFAFFNNGPETGLATLPDPPPTLELTTAEQQARSERLRAERFEADAALERIDQSLRDSVAAWESTAADELSAGADQLAAHVAFEPDVVRRALLPVARTSTGKSARPTSSDGQSRAVEKGGSLTYEPGVLGQAVLLDAMRHVELPHDVLPDVDQPWSIGVWIKPTGSLNCVLSKIEPTETRRGIEVLWAKGRIQVHLVNHWGIHTIAVKTKEPPLGSDWRHIVVRYDGSRRAAGVNVSVDGLAAELNVERDSLVGSMNNDQPLSIGRRDNGLGFYGHLDELCVFHRSLGDEEILRWYWSDRIRGILAVAADQRGAERQAFLRDYYIQHHGNDAARAALRAVTRTREAEQSFRAQLPKTLVMQELPQPRPTHLLRRGQYDQPGDVVEPAVPVWLSPPQEADGIAVSPPRDRLDLSRWLTSPTHPLTARVAVNRLWQVCFGEGLVRTTNDFGSQGEPPTHPELLDWLAVHFIESGWNVKEMLRLIVTSATYRQSSVPSESLLALDPENLLLARGPRFRLPAEMIRDQAIFVSGLLVERVGGPSVKPYQPPGLWEAVSYDGEASYVPDRGDGLWRRSLYTYWKRQAPPPAFLIFDAPTRETCSVRRPRTNTPAQALVLLNDETYVAAARRLAALALALHVDQPNGDERADLDRLRFAFRRATSRMPDVSECDVLRCLLAQQRSRFATDHPAAERLVEVGPALLPVSNPTTGKSARPTIRGSPAAELPEHDLVERAAWTAVAQVILNLDESLTSR